MSMLDTSGVFDLSALKKEEKQHTGTQSPSQTIPGPWVVDVTEKNLEHVLQTSMSLPVVVVFSAPESEHSLTLVSQLKQVTESYAGRLQLAVVDASVERGVAGAFGVNAVPTAIAMLQGQPVPLFQGLPDEQSLKATVTKLLEAATQYSLTAVLDGDPEGVVPEPEIPPLHKEGLAALEAGRLDDAHAAYSKALKENPGDEEAKVALHQVELLQRVQDINPPTSVLTTSVESANAVAPFTEVEVHLQLADVELSSGNAASAFARILEVVKVTSGDDRDKARTRLLELFDVVGQHSELVQQTRRALTNILF
ncbi:putative thioredoxin [Arcanobacterium phocae]|uniref:Putative thioredoxin n=1 Tax=Arcanobacterium phocae TaxID=131112 RepID=A0A1H2LA23_9ACTO|nr:tetratricopeptide repeat protein [Arcanobacterium phocae]SDU77565.1 putative thioredoxin [Arcanobacterium phocae]